MRVSLRLCAFLPVLYLVLSATVAVATSFSDSHGVCRQSNSAQEMLGRAERLVGSRSRSVHGGTFHGTAHRLLRRFGPEAGIPADFTILDQGDAADLMQLSRAALGLADKKKRFPKKDVAYLASN